MVTPSISLPNDNLNHWRWIPLLTPAVKEDYCDVDYSLLSSRIVTVGIAIIATMGSSMLLAASFPIAAINAVPLSVLLFGILPLDSWIAERAANVKAVNEYLNMSYPSKSATSRIQHNFKAAQLLVSKNGDVNKVNEEGDKLLAYVPDLNIFKLLIDHGVDVKSLDKYGTPYFQRAVEDENPAYLEYILRSSKAKSTDFDSKQQMHFWKNLGSVKAGYLLKSYGFDINIKDNEGYTPLLRIVENASGRFYTRNKLGIGAHVSALLNCGADRSITVDVNGTQKNAMQINTNQAIRNILQQS